MRRGPLVLVVVAAAGWGAFACGAFADASNPQGDGGVDPFEGGTGPDAIGGDATTDEPRPTDADEVCASRAAKFAGMQSFEVGSSAATGLDPSKLTVEAWIYVRKTAATKKMHIVSHIEENDAAGWALALEPGPRLTWYSYAGGPLPLSALSVVPADRWVHVAATRDGATVQLWIDGKADALSDNLTMGAATTRNLRIGADSTGGGNGFEGLIEEVRISGVVREIFTARVPKAPDPDTIALWGFEEIDGDAKDATGTKDAALRGVIPRVCMKTFADDAVTPP